MKRMGSIGSCVGPEVTTTWRPANKPAPPAGAESAAPDRLHDLGRLAHTSRAIFAAGHLAVFWSDEQSAVRA